MLIAWQAINAVRWPGSREFTRGFLVVTHGVTIRDRLRVLQPNDPNSYYVSRELVPNDTLRDLERAKIVVTNYHARSCGARRCRCRRAAAPCCRDPGSSCGRRRAKGRC